MLSFGVSKSLMEGCFLVFFTTWDCKLFSDVLALLRPRKDLTFTSSQCLPECFITKPGSVVNFVG